jgi:hypothetical protein
MNFIQNFFSPLLVFICGAFLGFYFSRSLRINILNSLGLYLWHTFFCLIYYWYVLNFGGDALHYYESAENKNFDFSFGTDWVTAITFFLVEFLSFSLLSSFLFFNIIGFVGLLFFLNCLKVAAYNKNQFITKVIYIIVFLPSISFWSSSVGKDSISFLAIALAMWAALKLNKRLLAMIISIMLMFVVRPHIAGMMLMALTLAVILENYNSTSKKIFLGTLLFIIALILIQFSLGYVGLNDGFSLEAFKAYVELRQSYNMEGDGGIDISNLSLPEQMFAYMFRPTIFEVNSIFSLAAAIDNLILLLLFVIGGYRILRGARSHLEESRVFMWTYSLIAWMVLAMTTANMGIAIRQKWMFAPCLIFLFISVMLEKSARYNTQILKGSPIAFAKVD